MTTTVQNLSPMVLQTYSNKLLAMPVPKLIHLRAASKRMMPARSGNTLVLRQPNPVDPSIVPLDASGKSPPPQPLTARDISAKIDYYGNYFLLTAETVLTNECPVLNQATMVLGKQMRESEDLLAREALNATSSVLNCTGGTNGDNPTEIARSDVDGAIRALVNANAHTVEQIINPTDKISTSSVRNAYLGFGSTMLTADLEGVTGFLAVQHYGNPAEGLDAEWGAVSNCRFLLSSQGMVEKGASQKGEDVYSIYIVGMDSYSTIKQSGASAHFIYRPPIYSGPLARFGSVGYRFACANTITHDQWIIKLRCTLKS